MDSDDAGVDLERVTSKPHFTFDDAFDDEDDGDAGFEFSTSAIRKELARNAAEWNEREEHDAHEESSELDGHAGDTSISTLDIGSAATLDEDSTPATEFEQISLSDNVQAGVHHKHDGEHAVNHAQVAQEENGCDAEHSEQEISFKEAIEEPSPLQFVVIDASESNAVGHIEHQLHHIPLDENGLSLPASPYHLPHPPNNTSAQSLNVSSNAPSASSSAPSPPSKPSSLPNSPTPQTAQSPPVTSPKSPTPSSPTTPRTAGHRHTRSVGPSALEKVLNKTRPPYLPPKPKAEDNKHLADWEKMMHQSRIAEEKRRKALQERRFAREKAVEASIELWNREIVPDWKVVNRNPNLRKLWWKGIPSKLRASMWEKAVGNALALGKDNYRTCHRRAQRALQSGKFSRATLDAIDEDIARTLPSLHLFRPETGPMHQDLRDMLFAWVVSRSDEGLGYIPGAASIAAMFLINMDAPQGFIAMRNLLERHCMRSIYGGESTKEDVEAYYRIFDTLLADGMPKIYFNFKQHQISPSAYLLAWLIPLFLDHLPFEACARIWDVLMLEGDPFLFRASLAVLAVLEPRLFFPDRKELLGLLRGENKAALEAAKRDNRPLDGGKYEIYGVDEETLWARIDGMEEWWKESTWKRLITRELPDI